MHPVSKKLGLGLEFTIFIIGLPLLMYAVLPVKYLLPMIWAAALYCYVIVRMIRHEGIGDDWNPKAINGANLKPILLRFIVCAVLMAMLTWCFTPELLFSFVRQNPAFWALIMLLYPMLSVVPQEVIFRQFFFMRYQPLFPRALLMIAMSGLAFAFAHILFHNWLAPVLCLIGGVMFAQTYHKTRSLALVALEHALYGDFLFTVGLGRYFYHGTVAAALH